MTFTSWVWGIFSAHRCRILNISFYKSKWFSCPKQRHVEGPLQMSSASGVAFPTRQPVSRTVSRHVSEGFSSPWITIHPPESPSRSHCRAARGSVPPLASETTSAITLLLPLPPPCLPVLQTLIINMKRNIRKQCTILLSSL